jgi:hypothetical protein
VMDVCLKVEPKLEQSEPGHLVACHLEVEERRRLGRELISKHSA